MSAPEQGAAEFIIRGNHLELTPSLRRYAEEKIGGLRRYVKELIQIEVELSFDQSGREGNAFRASARVRLPGPDLVAQERASGPHEAVDLLRDTLKIQLLRHKEREQSKRRRKV